MIEWQAIPTAAGVFAVSDEWKGMLQLMGFFPHRWRGERSQVNAHKLISMMSVSKNSRSGGCMIRVTSFPLFPTWASTKEGSSEGKTKHPALFLFFQLHFSFLYADASLRAYKSLVSYPATPSCLPPWQEKSHYLLPMVTFSFCLPQKMKDFTRMCCPLYA